MDGSREFGRKQEYRSAQEVRCTKKRIESTEGRGKRSDTLGNAFGREGHLEKNRCRSCSGKDKKRGGFRVGVVWAEDRDRHRPLCRNVLLPFFLQVAGRQHLYMPSRLQGWSMLSLVPAAREN